MGQLIDGIWSDEDILSEIQADGSYAKKPSIFRRAITADGSSGFKAETGRYHLYSSTGCPWAHRTVLFRALKKLDNVIEHHETAQNPAGGGWWFEGDNHQVPGTDSEATHLHEIYALADPGYTGKVSVPTLWDAHEKTIINNESSEIIRMFNSEFAEFTPDTPDLCPPELLGKIDEMNQLILAGVNDAVNGCGRSKSQQAYEEAYEILFSTFDKLESILASQRYLCGSQMTESDLRLYPTFIRFDSVYYLGYKCNKRRLEDYPNLSGYLRDLYQTPGIAEVSDVELMKKRIYSIGGPIATNGIVPKGPELGLDRPHGREKLSQAA
jgi:putative glutathione S-transferase